MVLMTMGDEDSADPIGSFPQIGNIRKDKIDPRLVFFGESDAAIDHDDIVFALEEEEITTDLGDSAEEDQSHRRTGQLKTTEL